MLLTLFASTHNLLIWLQIDDTFDSLKNLQHLDLSVNKLRGHVPHGLGTLTQLRDLRLSDNLLTATFPASLISLSNLQTLLLDSNAISGSLPPLVGEMRSLVTLRYARDLILLIFVIHSSSFLVMIC